MALVPDMAVDRMYHELTSGARDLYIFLARCRNQKSGKCCPSVSTTMGCLGLSRARVYVLRRELSDKHWASFQGDKVTELLGFNSLENKTNHLGPENKNESGSLENETPSIANTEDNPITASSLENETTNVASEQVKGNSLENKTCFPVNESRKQDKIVLKTRLAYKEEPAKEPAKNKRSSGSEKKPEGSAEYVQTRDVCYETFCTRYQEVYGLPYRNRKPDFIQLDDLLKTCTSKNWPLTLERWEKALSNYFASDIGKHTLAALAADFSTFYRSPLDRFKQPMFSKNGAVPHGKNQTKFETKQERDERINRKNLQHVGIIESAAEQGGERAAPAGYLDSDYES